LDALAQAVDGADGAARPGYGPHALDAESGYAQVSRALDATLGNWAALRVEADRC